MVQAEINGVPLPFPEVNGRDLGLGFNTVVQTPLGLFVVSLNGSQEFDLVERTSGLGGVKFWSAKENPGERYIEFLRGLRNETYNSPRWPPSAAVKGREHELIAILSGRNSTRKVYGEFRLVKV